jgi:hypothetical protein
LNVVRVRGGLRVGFCKWSCGKGLCCKNKKK